jgi:hypothetical protein
MPKPLSDIHVELTIAVGIEIGSGQVPSGIGLAPHRLPRTRFQIAAAIIVQDPH